MQQFSGRVAIVTGAADGLGRAVSVSLAKAGCAVVLVDIDRDRLSETEQLVAETGSRGVSFLANVADAEAVKGYVAHAVKAFGRIDGFFNNAGVLGPSLPLIEYPDEQFDKVIAVNLKGVFLGLKHVLPVMIKQGYGAVVNTASMAAAGGIPLLTPYTASKHGVIGLTRIAALETAKSGVRVNAVLPGNIKTKMMVEGLTEAEARQRYELGGALVPQGHMGEAQDIANAVLFLLSDESRHITGIQLPVDGGITAQVYPSYEAG